MITLLHRFAIGAVLFGAAVALGGPLGVSPALAQRLPGDCTIDDAELELSQIEQDMLKVINAYRAEKGLQAVEVSKPLTKAAVWKASAGANGAPWAHDDPDRTWDLRIGDCGYAYDAPSNMVGENLADFEGSVPAADEAKLILEAWKASPVHHEVLTDGVYRHIGIARVRKGNATYWTTDFAKFSDAEAAEAMASRSAAGGQPSGESASSPASNEAPAE